MNEREQAIAERMRDAVNDYSRGTDRSQQIKLGVSSIGFCQERTRRELLDQEPSDHVDWNKAFIGTAVGEYIEKAQLAHMWPNAIFQASIEVSIEAASRTYILPGHPDVVIPPCEDFPGGAVIDNKAVNGLVWVSRKETADANYQFQRNLYAIACHRAGMLGDGPLEEVEVGNIYYDRSGESAVPHVQIEKVNPDLLFDAAEWLDDVAYAIQTGEEAKKEPPREMCAVACEFFTVCRAYDTDVEGLITHEDTLSAIDMYLEGAELEKAGKRLKQAATIKLNGVEGNTADVSVRWTEIQGSEIAYYRQPYMRLGVTKRKRPKR